MGWIGDGGERGMVESAADGGGREERGYEGERGLRSGWVIGNGVCGRRMETSGSVMRV
jgi:hypothetical protein